MNIMSQSNFLLVKRVSQLSLFILLIFLSLPIEVLAGNSPLGDTAATWPSSFSIYHKADGTQIKDDDGDQNPGYSDISSGATSGVGSLPSVYLAYDGKNVFFRLRIHDDPSDASHGGFKSFAYSVVVGVGGTQAATIGVNGKSSSVDEVYIANADGSQSSIIYTYPFTGISTGARSLADGSGHYFVDFQVPLSRITQRVPSITASTPVQLFYGTSTSNNLSVINKDYMTGNSVTFTGLATVYFSSPSIPVLTKSSTLFSGPNPPTTGQTSTYNLSLSLVATGMNALSGTVVTDTIPSGVTIVNATTSTGSIVTNGQVVSWSPGTIQPGVSVAATIRVSVTPTSAQYSSTLTLNPGAYSSGTDVQKNVLTKDTSNAITVGPVRGTPQITISGGENVLTNDNTPTISGTTNANTGSVVTVTINGIFQTATVQSGGTWTLTWTTTLSNSTHTVNASVTAEGTGTDTQSITIDTTPPSVVVTSPTNGSSTTDNTPLITGTVEANSTVRVYIDNTLVSTITSTPLGTWSYTSTTLAEGAHSVYATATDAAGNLATSSVNSFSVDMTPPTIVINNGNPIITNDQTPTISGTCSEPNGTTVSITVNGQTNTTTVNSGTWTINWPTTLSQSSYTASASVSDAAGNTSTTSQPLTIDTTAPSVAISTPTNGSSTNDNTVLVTGTAEAGSVVRVSIDGVLDTTMTVPGSGVWSYTTDPLSDGSHTVSATTTDAAGNVGTATSKTFTVDTVPPTITINGGASRLTTDTTPTISGTSSEPNGRTISITINGQTNTTTVSGGTYTLDWPTVLAEATYTVTASVTDLGGNTATATQQLSIDTTPPLLTVSAPTNGQTTNDNTPLITGTTDPGDTVKVYVDGNLVATLIGDGSGNWSTTSAPLSDGSHSVVVTATEPSGTTTTSPTISFTIDTVAPTIQINNGNAILTNDVTPAIPGTSSEPNGTTISVTINGQTNTTTMSGGSWSIANWSPSLAEGTYLVSASVTDAAGNTAATSVSLTVDATAPSVAVTSPANGSTTSDNTPLITGTAETGTTVKVYVDGNLVTTISVNGSGTWSYTSATLVDGSHTVSATATDNAGNVGTSATNTFTVFGTAPTITINSGNPIRTNDNTPTITGTSNTPAGTTVSVTINGSTNTTTVQSGGIWSINWPTTLSDGNYPVTASVTYASQTATDNQTLTIDTVAPAVTVDSPANGSATNDNTPLVASGSTEPGVTVIVKVDGTPIDTVTADNNGDWSTTSPTLSDGSHTVTAVAIDVVGNSSTATSTFTVDTTVPTITITGGASVTTNDRTPTISGTTSEANGTTISITLNSQTFTTTASGGTWTRDWPTTLADGTYPTTASVTDAAGNSATANQNITVDGTAPSVAISSPTNGSTTSDNTPLINGTAETGTTVRVYVDGNLAATLPVNGSGTWNYTSAILSDGSHTVQATATDNAGNVGTSSTNTFTVAASAPTVTINNGNPIQTNDNTPTITGTSNTPAGTIVSLTINGTTNTTTVQANGTWSMTWTTLADGNYPMTASVTYLSQTGTDTQTLTIDTAAPTVTIDSPANGSSTNDNTPLIASGSTEPGVTVIVKVDGTPVDTVTADNNGDWSTTSPLLGDGSHTVTATATDVVGNSANVSSTFTVDTVVPTITINGSATIITNDRTPTISGTTSEPNGTTISITLNSQTFTTTASGGTWTIDWPTTLSDATYPVTASVSDAAGNSVSTSKNIQIDATAPSVAITSPTNGSTTTDNTPLMTGTAETGTTVRLYVDGNLVSTIPVNGSGTWSFTSSTLVDGVHTLQATATDNAGNVGTSSINSFTVAGTAPTVTINNGNPIRTNDNTPTITGTSNTPAGTTISITIYGVTNTTTVQSGGTWSITWATLADGNYNISASVTYLTLTGTDTQTLTIDTVAPTVTIDSPTNGSATNDNTPVIFSGNTEPGITVVIAVDGTPIDTVTADNNGDWSTTSPALSDGPHTITATGTDVVGNSSVATVTVTIDTVLPTITINGGSSVYTNDQTPTIAGTTSEPNGTTISITINGQTRTTTATGGTWSIDWPITLSDATYPVTASVTDGTGNSASTSQTLIVDVTTPVVTITSPTNGGATNDNTPTITGTSEPGSQVIVYVDGVPVDTVTANGAGAWTYTSPTLADGNHTVSATSTDPAGNNGSSPTVTFTIDSTPPTIVINSGNAIVTNDNTPRIPGTSSEPNGTNVSVTLDGQTNITPMSGGAWFIDWPLTLADGSYIVTARVTDAAGNSTATSQTVTIDRTAPAVAISAPTSGSTLADNTPIILGTAEPASTVKVYVDGILIGTVTADGVGNWGIVSPVLTDGNHNVYATATDGSGNVGTSPTRTFTVDSGLPTVVINNGNPIFTNDNTPTISGSTSEPTGTTITIIVNGTTRTATASGGTWTINWPITLSTGTYVVNASVTDVAGNTATTAQPLTLDATAPSVEITSPIAGSKINDNTPLIEGLSEPSATVKVYVDGVLIGTVTTNNAGYWSITSPTLTEGNHNVYARANDDAGNAAFTPTRTFTVDAVPPTVTIDGGSFRTTNDNTPTISGTCSEPNGTVVTISLNGQQGTATVTDHAWSINWPFVLADSTYIINASATDATNNTGTANQALTVDSTPPTISVTKPASGEVTDDNTPETSGTTEPDASVAVYIDGTLRGTVTADGLGTWTFESPLLSDGNHTVYAVATDAGGNTATSATVPFTVAALPQIISIDPSERYVGTGAFTMTVTGKSFNPNSIVKLNGSARTTRYISPTQLQTDINSTDVLTISTLPVTVYNPAPANVTSQSFPFSVLGSVVSGIVYFDANSNGVKDVNELGMSNVTVNAVASTPSYSSSTTTEIGGTYTFSNLQMSTYTVSPALASTWTMVSPASGSYVLNLTVGKDTSGLDFASITSSDTGTYRTFTPVDLTIKKAISRKKCNGFRFAFNFKNNTGRVANGIYVEFNNVVTQFTSVEPFEEVQDLGQNAQDYKFIGPDVDTGVTIQVSGFSAVTPCRIKINKWWWLYNDVNISVKRSEGPMKAAFFTTTLPMPNAANARDEVMSNGQIISYGLIAGIAQSSADAKKYGWVDIRKSADLMGTMFDKKGLHTGAPRGFTNGIGQIVNKQKKLPPSKHNNRLMAEVLALKFNIWASALQVTPKGFGELVYEEVDNPLSGLMIKQIGMRADTFLTYWKNVDSSVYYNLDTTIRKLNLAFNGDIDSTQFAVKTTLKGFKSVADVEFLRPNPNIEPTVFADDRSLRTIFNNEIPEAFSLHQNYPNPFNPTTTLSFDLPVDGFVNLTIYDMLGKEIATLLNNEPLDAGTQYYEFDASSLPSGIYYYRINVTATANDDEYTGERNFVSTKKMVLVK